MMTMPKIVVLKPASYKQLVQDAKRTYGQEHGHELVESNGEFMARVLVNHVRHNLTNYDQLWRLAAKRGGDRAVAAVKATVLAEIARVHPILATECARQAAECELRMAA